MTSVLVWSACSTVCSYPHNGIKVFVGDWLARQAFFNIF